MKEDISRILKMVEEGKIDADKATELISAIKEKENESLDTIILDKKTNQEKMLKIKVRSVKGDNVDVKLPIKFVKAMLNVGSKIPGMSMKGENGYEIDMNIISSAIDNDINGKIVDVKSANGDIVEVVIE
ncbi:SHOCT-like domain-containing protein [Clostridium sp. JNZ J1-5]|nr:hypothetical protein [Clostridium sp.]